MERTHGLEYLAQLCSDPEPTFSGILDDARTLTPYCVLFRYPGVVSEPSEQDVTEAIRKAERIVVFVKGLVA